jgi:hypothetical protein
MRSMLRATVNVLRGARRPGQFLPPQISIDGGFQASQGALRGTARGLRGLRGAGCTVEDSAGISEPGGPTRWLWGCLADWCDRQNLERR